MKIEKHHIKQAGVSAVLATMIAVVESKSILGAVHSQLDPIAGYQMGAISGLSALLAFVGFNLVGAFKDDVRWQVRRRVLPTRIIALAFLIAPICFLGSSLKMDRLEAHYAVYAASPAFAADTATVADPAADRYDREEARARIARPVTPDLNIFDGELWIAIFLLGLLNFGGEALRVPAPCSDEEREHIRRCEIAAKGQATRRRNAAKRQAAKQKREGKPERSFGILQGGKR